MSTKSVSAPLPMDALINAIRSYQEAYELSDKQIAEKLGVPRTTWMMIRRRNYLPRLAFAKRALAHPEFTAAARRALLE